MATQETIKQLFSGGVLRDIEDVYARQTITALQNALNALTSGDTTTAIENFQEVIDFLAGVTDDATLIGKLNELRTLINEKYTKPSTGIPASDLANGVIPDVSGLATKTEVNTGLAGKVDKVTGKGLSKNDYTDADMAKVASAIQGVIVGSTEVTPDSNKKVTIPTGVDGITPHIGANGHWWVGPETDSSNDTGVNATGNNGTSYTSADLKIGNALNGQGDVLGMSGAMKMKNNIDAVQANLVKLYNKLANMAFWDATDQADAEPIPTLLDWSVPKKTLTVVNSITHGIVMYNGEPVSSPIQVDMGTTVNLLVVGDTGYGISSVDNITGATIVDNEDGTFTVSIVVDDTMTVTISGMAAVEEEDITYILTNCDKTSGPSTVQYGGTATILLQAKPFHIMPSTLPNGAVTGASVTSYTVDANDDTKATLVIGSVSGDVTITITAISSILFLRGSFYLISKSPAYFALGSGDNATNRACVVVLRSSTDNPCAWVTTNAGVVDNKRMNTYSAIPIPSGTTKISIKCNAEYYYFPGLIDSNAVVLDASPQWYAGSTKKEYVLADYPTATHLAVSFKIGSDGNTAFSNETYKSMGIELTFE